MDLAEELDRELTDVFQDGHDLLYYFFSVPAVMMQPRLRAVFECAGIEPERHERVLDFLLYYGVVGLRTAQKDYYIYSVNYNLNMLKIRATSKSAGAEYILNPAFWPAFEVEEPTIAG